jgi:hypothetical protein
MANFPINPRVMLTVLYDHKFYNGQLVSFNQFKEFKKGALNAKEALKEWDKMETTVRDVLEVKEGKMEFNMQKMMDYSGKTLEEAEFMKVDIIQQLTNKINLAIQDIDQNITDEQKSIAARHGLMSFFAIHRSWLFLATQRKFKNRHSSLASGQEEEGSWRTFGRVIGELYKGTDKKNLLKSFKEQWDKSTNNELARTNLKRVAVDLGVLNLLVVATYLMIQELDDDDEDSWMFQTTAYLLMRTTNEVASGTVSLPKNLYDTLENTIVGLNSIEIITDAPDMISSEEIQSGRYKGMTESERYFFKHYPILKEYNNMTGMEGTIDTYKYFNLEKDGGNLRFTLYGLFRAMDKAEEEQDIEE